MNEEQQHTKTTNSLADEIADLQKLLANLDFSTAINSIRETKSPVSFLLVCVLKNLNSKSMETKIINDRIYILTMDENIIAQVMQ